MSREGLPVTSAKAAPPFSPPPSSPPPPSPPSQPARALLIDDLVFDRHRPPGHHPERPERLAAARSAIQASGDRFDRVEGRAASDEELARVHDAEFLEGLTKLTGHRGYLDPDTYVSPESVDIARFAAGSLTAMAERLIAGPVAKGVALIRPPGHHAGRSRAMGFCLLNSVAVAAAHALAHGLQRVAIVDWDVHHGNGTQEIFWRDPRVLYLSTHQFPFYPGTGDADEVGKGDGAGYTVNVPLAAGGNDAVYASAFERVVVPILEEYAPELVLVSAGFDASARDPLAQMELSASAFGWMARELARVADASARGRMALVLEGGYDLVALQAGLESAIAGMLDRKADDLARADDDEGVQRALAWAKKAWGPALAL
jgi:acetoin utilization deacetylase AcuC-like enzyme